MVSIKDVARHAGVAISTVSKVLNHYPNVSEETKKKVNEAVEELNFLPNSVAAALSSKQAGRMALLVNLNTRTQAIDEIDMRYISGAINKAAELGLDVNTFFFSMFEGMSEEEAIRYLRSQSIHGIIIYGLSKNDEMLHGLLRSQIFKAVVVDAPIVNESTSCVSIDQEKAQYDVAKKTIIDNKCKSVLYIAGKENGYVTEERLRGMRKLAEELELELLVKEGDFSERKAREITFQNAREKDILVCASDLMAIGAMRALMEMDIFRPVCGFDGITLMGYAGKQMNTVRQGFAEISEAAVEELHYLMNGGEGRKKRLDYNIIRLQYPDIIC